MINPLKAFGLTVGFFIFSSVVVYEFAHLKYRCFLTYICCSTVIEVVGFNLLLVPCLLHAFLSVSPSPSSSSVSASYSKFIFRQAGWFSQNYNCHITCLCTSLS